MARPRRSPPHLLRGEEGLENPGERVVVDPDTRVGHIEGDVVARDDLRVLRGALGADGAGRVV